ncbi:hypothetical protein [Chitinophaga pinensis]|uniref:Uncharacterized protein n=1 Tax=Chitinophaga pinensis (strain ATCC 43595 / DSM 2588 / LMG 13176 / NBRC 15968 / NCIMB 11800 / UQM 2034) TaxID=485918 RepID=A0A979G5Z7_CHIPD|nr:hypothetical protein [Chitinophaga pinensis]ACU61313.1 conserved hypothetical protein [Chitinophaga pinensis DSM 2588]
MARIRTIKPDFFKNEELAELPAMVRLLFIGLWTLADREGRMHDRPKRIKAEIFPYDNVNIENDLARLQSAGFIERYEVGEMKVIQVNNFTKHQRITGSEALSHSEFPAPQTAAQESEKQGGNTEETFGNTEETPRTTGKERKGKEGKGVYRAQEIPEREADELKDQSEANAPPVPPPPPPRQNKGPCIEAVLEFFRRAGGTEEMAHGFWNKWESVNWMNGMSPIAQWPPLANNYIASWHRNDEQKAKSHGSGRKQTVTGSIEAIDAATADIIRDLDEAARLQRSD